MTLGSARTSPASAADRIRSAPAPGNDRVGARVRLPGPRRARNPVREVVRTGDRATCLPRAVRRRISEHRLGRAAVDGLAHDRPAVVAPRHRLQVRHAAERAAILEVEEPVAPIGRGHPGTLVRPVDRRGSLREHVPRRVWAVHIARAEHRLPARGDPAGGREDVVPAVALVELRPLDRVPAVDVGAVDHVAGGPRGAAQRGIDGSERQHVLPPRARSRPAEHEVGTAVVIPQRAGVDEPEPGEQEVRRGPGPGRIGRGDDEDALVGVGIDDVERAVVVPDRRRPHAAAVAGQAEPVARFVRRERVARALPVDQVGRDVHRQSRRPVEARRDHDIAVIDAHGVGIRKIGVDDRIAVPGLGIEVRHGIKIT